MKSRYRYTVAKGVLAGLLAAIVAIAVKYLLALKANVGLAGYSGPDAVEISIGLMLLLAAVGVGAVLLMLMLGTKQD